MILFEIMLELKDALAAKGVPFEVVYGPEKTIPKAVGARSRIVLERDREAGDGIGGSRDHHTNPHMVGFTAIGCVVRIFARSERKQADIHDHEGVADELRSHVRVCLDKIIRGNQTLWTPTGAKFLSAEELGLRGITTWPGVVYEMTFTVDAGDFDRNYAGEAAPEAQIGSGPDGVRFKKNTVVKVNGSDTEAPACGDP